jgi:hypothetical protein
VWSARCVWRKEDEKGMIARYISRDVERASVLALVAWRFLATGSPYPTGRSKSRDAPSPRGAGTQPEQPIVEEVEHVDAKLGLAG